MTAVEPGLYPRFSPGEYRRRHDGAGELMACEGLDALVVFGWSAMGRAAQADVHYLCGYLGMRDNYVVLPAAGDPVLLVQNFNHVPNARAVSAIEDVRWGGEDNGATLGALLSDRGLRQVGVVGWMPYQQHDAMRAAAPGSSFRDVTRGFRLLRVDKSEEELEWLRRGARLTDLALASLAESARPGMREQELAGVMERAYAAEGGMTSLHYVASTPMSAPDRCVPAQVLSERELRAGDLILTEISVAYAGYAGQGLRSYTVAAEPSPLIAELHDLALSVYDAVAKAIVPGATQEDVWAAADVIAERGYTICDGLVHGYGMGILPPGMRTRQTSGPEAARPWTFAAGQTVVVQPNVVTEDQSAGVQVGDLCVVTERGAESLHAFPRELVRCG